MSEPKNERRGNGRRQLDKIMERNISALQASQAETHGLLLGHLNECSENYLKLKASVDTVSAYVEPMIAKAQARAEAWDKVLKTVQTDWMVAILKYGPPIVLLALIAILFPTAAAVLQDIMKVLAKALLGG